MAVTANEIIVRGTQAALVVMGAGGMIGGLDLGLWSWGGPGPGLFPFAASCLLLGCVLLRTLVPYRGAEEEPVNWRRVVLYAASIVILIVLFMYLGFIIGTVIGIFMIMNIAEEQPVLSSILASVIITAVCMGIFDYMLKVPLPYGPLQPLKFWM